LSPGVRLDWYALLEQMTVDPRLSARFALSPKTTLTGGVGLYSQAPQPQDTDPNFGNPHIGPEHTVHASIGIERTLLRGLEATATAFYKYLYDLSTASGQPVLEPNGQIRKEGVASQGTGFVIGGEML